MNLAGLRGRGVGYWCKFSPVEGSLICDVCLTLVRVALPGQIELIAAALRRRLHVERPDSPWSIVDGSVRLDAAIIQVETDEMAGWSTAARLRDRAHDAELLLFAPAELTFSDHERAALLGAPIITPQLLSLALRGLARRIHRGICWHGAMTADAWMLSRRQHQILLRLADNQPRRLIASDLGIAATSVDTHVDHLVRKLEVDSTKELIDCVLFRRAPVR